MIPRENGFLSEILRAHGYATLRRRQVAPHARRRDEHGRVARELAARPRLRPLVRVPRRRDAPVRARRSTTTTTRCSRPATYEDGYHLSADLADRAIEFLSDLRAVDAEQPFFCYFATGACHSPHHAPPEWIERYHGQFDARLGRVARRDLRPPARERPPAARHRSCRRARTGCRRGTSWQPEDQAVAARFMECFAAYLSYTDAQIGRVLDFLDETGDLDNTVIIAVLRQRRELRGRRARFDQRRPLLERRRRPAGASCAPASTSSAVRPTHNNYPWGWTMAGNTPFKRWKREVHEGGVADPCIVRLPPAARVARHGGGIRHQFAHAIDVLPTVLELVGIDAPDRDRRRRAVADRRHELRVRAAPTRPRPRRHDTQYFEMLGSRGDLPRRLEGGDVPPARHMYDDGLDPDAPFDDDVWELYHVADDLVGDQRPRRGGAGAARRA